MIDEATKASVAFEEHEDEDAFALAEETDLNEEELDLNVSRKMSIRALHVASMLRFPAQNLSKNYTTRTEQKPASHSRLAVNAPLNQANAANGYLPPKQPLYHRPSLLLRASNLIRRSSLNHRASRISNLRNVK